MNVCAWEGAVNECVHVCACACVCMCEGVTHLVSFDNKYRCSVQGILTWCWKKF